MTPFLENIIRVAAATENTPELRIYWEKRYVEAQNKNLFRISDKTLELIATTKQNFKPATTYADIFLLKHLDNLNTLQESLLQDTIETLVRLLDALLEAINFTPEALDIIRQYRKIAIGIGDLEAYLIQIKTLSRQDTVNYLGSFISTKAYRSSESLAEEKGACLSWGKIKKHLRAKQFELWYNKEDGVIKNSLDLINEFDQNSIIDTPFEVIPRRNSSLLLFPQTEDWASWTDRDQNSPKTVLKDLPPEKILEENTSDNLSVTIQTGTPVNNEPMFQIGELVQIQKKGDEHDQDIFQVVDIKNSQDNQNLQYQLSNGQKDVEEQLWDEGNLSVVELSELLEVLNSAKNKSKDLKPVTVESWSRALVIDFNSNQILVEKDGENLNLPGILIQKNQVPEKILLRHVFEQYKASCKIEEEIGTAISISENNGIPSQIHLGFVINKGDLFQSVNYTFVALDHKDLPRYALVLLEKLHRKRNNLESLKQELENAIKEKNELEQLVSIKTEEARIIQNKYFSNQNGIRDYKPEVLAVAVGSLSKYVLKLEQLIQTDIFEEVLLTLTYDGYGPRIVKLQASSLNIETQEILELFIELINFILTNDIHPIFVAEKLAFSNHSHINLPIKDLLQLIGSCLKNAPQRVQEIDSSLIEVIDEKNLNKIQKHDIL